MTDKEIIERAKEAEKRTCFGELVHSPISKGVNSAFGIGFIEGMVEYRKSMQQEPASEDLEKAARKYAGIPEDSPHDLKYCVQDKKAKYDAMLYGANWQKEQLLAKAVDGVVHHFEKCGVASVHYTDPTGVPMAYFTSPEGLSAGDKIKIIVIKED